MNSAVTVVAESAPAWGGAVAGLIALGIFVVFSGWIIAQRMRAKSTAQRTGTRGSGQRTGGQQADRHEPERKDVNA